VTILAGKSAATVQVVPSDDTIPEPTENVIVTVAVDPYYWVSVKGSATVTISDND